MNNVEIQGMLSHLPVERKLANGDTSLNWRIKVQRQDSGSDSIPCTITYEKSSKSILNRLLNLEIGNFVEISGELRSRYWQGSAGSSSRIEVEVFAIKKISKKQLAQSG